MFLIDKYKPINQTDAFFHRELLNLLDIMSKDEAIPHIIFYGPNGSGKKTIIKLFLEMLFDRSINNIRNTPYKVNGSGNKTTMENVKQSDYHIIIDPKNNNSDRYLIHDIVKEYSKRRTLNVFQTNRSFKVVLINNIDSMSYYAQTSLRRTMERYNDKCRFIMWCRSLSKVIKPLQSRCICIRIPSPSNTDMFKYVIDISVREGILLSMDKYADIIKKSNGNIKKALWELEFSRYSYELDTDYYSSMDKIVDMLLELSLNNITKKNGIRDILFNLMITNFEASAIMRDIIDAICKSSKISDLSKQKIVSTCAEYDYQLVKGRREIIQFDAMMTAIMHILNEEKQQLAKS